MNNSNSNTKPYRNGDIVWYKLSKVWWPCEVIDHNRLPEDVVCSLRRPPLVVVKFFDEYKLYVYYYK